MVAAKGVIWVQARRPHRSREGIRDATSNSNSTFPDILRAEGPLACAWFLCLCRGLLWGVFVTPFSTLGNASLQQAELERWHI